MLENPGNYEIVGFLAPLLIFYFKRKLGNLSISAQGHIRYEFTTSNDDEDTQDA